MHFRDQLAQSGVGICYPEKSEHYCLLCSWNQDVTIRSQRESTEPEKVSVFNPSDSLLVPIFNCTAKHLPGRPNVACNWISLRLLTIALQIPDKILTQMREWQHFSTEPYVSVQVCFRDDLNFPTHLKDTLGHKRSFHSWYQVSHLCSAIASFTYMEEYRADAGHYCLCSAQNVYKIFGSESSSFMGAIIHCMPFENGKPIL